jgi:hypothetical protein
MNNRTMPISLATGPFHLPSASLRAPMPSPTFRYLRQLLISGVMAILVMVQSCNPVQEIGDPDTFYHQRMVEILDSMRRVADPLVYFNMNAERAEWLAGQLRTLQGDEQLDLTFNYGVELLKAGMTERAILQFETLLDALDDEPGPKTRLLYEMLALSYLRLGEQAHCVETHTAMSCVLPIRGEGRFRQEQSTRTAIRLYRQLLDEYPDDLQSIWLYNLAHMAIGAWPSQVPSEYRLSDSLFLLREELPFQSVAMMLGLDLRSVAGSVSMEDFDGDGFLDLFITGYLAADTCRLFRNNGNGTFSERTREANLTGIMGGLNVLHADYNNDGWPDILVLRGGWLAGNTFPNSLLRNNGDGTFTDVTIPAGLLAFHPTQAAGWADVDGDGWLDLFIANETFSPQDPHPCAFYHNNGDGTFTEMAKVLRLDFTSYYKAVSWGDIDGDGRPDLYLSDLNGPNKLLYNQGGKSIRDWRFENLAPLLGLEHPRNSFPAFFFDYNNDGRDDLLVSSYEMDYQEGSALPFFRQFLGKGQEGRHMCLYRNEGGLRFTDVAEASGLNHLCYPMGHNVGDLDLDGFPDIFLATGLPDLRALIPNRVFLNDAGQRFQDVSMGTFSHIQKGHGVAFGDLDNDGDLDIYLVTGGAFDGDLAFNQLYLNQQNGGQWLTLRLEGTSANRDAIGARIRVRVEDPEGVQRDIWTSVNTGGSFGSSSLRRTIGLGNARRILWAEVSWPLPGNPSQRFSALEPNRAYQIIQGESEVRPLLLPLVEWLTK